eukprot:TRINITY_DN48424_c0_g1_i1.p1 TRINITY_DN48424_c0_g1~~TRINITY_DN48424_c0_g1_i1.p1  ORF type:complete len:354 (+),score=64.53 TRINITY_DN48424_c0_g1_i1:55-1116(+)
MVLRVLCSGTQGSHDAPLLGTWSALVTQRRRWGSFKPARRRKYAACVVAVVAATCCLCMWQSEDAPAALRLKMELPPWTFKSREDIRKLGDYSPQAAALFDNMRGPAALLIGALVPLGFYDVPKLSDGRAEPLTPEKRAHYLLSTASICCLLTTIVWATVSVNKLAEVRHEPTYDVMQLLKRDYELAWIGSNVNFMMGLFGFAACLISFGLISFGVIGKCVAFMCASSMCLMVSVINGGIAQGDGSNKGVRFGSNLATMFCRYMYLLVTKMIRGRKFFMGLAFVFAFFAAVIAVALIVCPLHDGHHPIRKTVKDKLRERLPSKDVSDASDRDLRSEDPSPSTSMKLLKVPRHK